MLEMIQHSGGVGLILVAIALTCLILTCRALLRLRTGTAAQLCVSKQALLFWGVVALLLGFVGHTAGIFMALSVIADHETVSGADIAEALRISLSPVFMGIGILTFASASWLALSIAGRKTTALTA